MTWDVVVVGARCAGSPLARQLALAGKRVLLVDAGTFPSDQPMSTHFIHGYGMRLLAELGLADKVEAICSPITGMYNAVEAHGAVLEPSTPARCPRRLDLDQILLDGARDAGAEVRLGQRVTEVLREGERVVGVVTVDKEGARTELRAEVVVGADGRHSTIAEAVGAEKYFAYEGPRAAYWGYWPRPAGYDAAPFHGHTQLVFRGDRYMFAFPTNRDQIIIGIGFPRDQVSKFKSDLLGSFVAEIRADPLLAPLVAEQPLGKVVGITKAELFFRRAAGPGWALVGDSGLFKDPAPGLGISDALRDAKALAHAILEGGDTALERYWRQRDVESFELFNFARDFGEIEYNNPLIRQLMRKMMTSATMRKRFVAVMDREISPYDAFTPLEVLGAVGAGLVRGQFGVLRPFLRALKRRNEVMAELTRRRALLVPALPGIPRQEQRAA
jgi:flavin-dependent dehydrogenase